MTLREAISNVRIPLKELNADVKLLTNKLIYSKLISAANILIQRDSDALKLDNSFFQTLKCEPLEEVPTIESCYGLRTRMTVFRTKNELPEMYTDLYGEIFGMITTVDNSRRITIAQPETIIRAKADPNAKYDKTIYGFFRDGKFYLADARYRALNIEGAFVYDISDRSKCNCENPDLSCKRFLDNDWMIPRKHRTPAIEAVLKELTETYVKIKSTNVIDKNENT